MESNKKFKLRRKTKILLRLAYSCLAFALVFFIITIVMRNYGNADWNTPSIKILMTLSYFLPFLLSMLSTIFALTPLHELNAYRGAIKNYRARKFATQTIEYLLLSETQLAVDEYLKSSWYPDVLDNYLYGMLIMACYNSNDQKLHVQGVKRIDIIKETFNTNKINLN